MPGYYESQGWVPLTGAAQAKAQAVTGEFRLDYAKRFGRKTVFMRDSGVLRLRAVGPRGEVYQMKVFAPSHLEDSAENVALAAKLGDASAYPSIFAARKETGPPMLTFRIRPNSKNPDWPTEPAERDLEAGRKLPNLKKLSDVKAWALAKTQARVAAQRRVGCGSDNLDWLDMVAKLRRDLKKARTETEPGIIPWIDGMCPSLTETTHFRIETRLGEVGPDWCTPGRYLYVNFVLTDG